MEAQAVSVVLADQCQVQAVAAAVVAPMVRIAKVGRRAAQAVGVDRIKAAMAASVSTRAKVKQIEKCDLKKH
jgi:hypothetical protein